MNKIEEVLNRYIQGTYQADLTLLQSVFHPGARMSGFLGGELILGTPEPFFQDLGSRPSMQSEHVPYQARILSISQAGKIASAVLLEEHFFGALSMETHFELLKLEEGWQIIAKNFTELN